MITLKNTKIGIIGLGYVGLPLAVEFGKKYPSVGFDINQSRVDELNTGHDSTLEVSDEDLRHLLALPKAGELGMTFTTEDKHLGDCNVFVVTVPTPIDKYNKPDLTPLRKASETLGKILKKDDVVIYESTVYPGATEEECIPVLEQYSGLKYNKDFYAGYSPERINPGDKLHTVTKIKKVTAGSTPEIAEFIDQLYQTVIEAGTFKASSIKVAEAAKVIENSQRDINIAFVNELAKIFNLLEIDTNDVLEAAATKWNFLPFRPGLVGGHCIGVDPYYLAQKAQEVGYHPEIILSGRRLNDSMGKHVASEVIKTIVKTGVQVLQSNVLILGITFKENCPDIRNTRIIDIYNELLEYECQVSIYDPWASAEEVEAEFGIRLISELPESNKYDAIVGAVAHKEFMDLDIRKQLKEKGVIYDVKGVFPKEIVNNRL